MHEHVTVDLTVEADTLDGGDRLGRGERLADQVTERHGLRGRHEQAGVDLGELEEVVDHAHGAVHLGADLPVVARRVVDHAVLERLGHRAQAGQWSAQVVGDPGDQLAARLLEPLLALTGLGSSLRELSRSCSFRAVNSAGPVTSASYRPDSPKRRAPSCSCRDERTTTAPTREAKQAETMPATRHTQSTTT